MKPHKISALLVNHSISCKMKLDDTMSKYKLDSSVQMGNN